MDNGVRLPAEWERGRAVMVSWPHEKTDWKDMLPEIHECYEKIIRAISKYAIVVIVGPDTSEARSRLQDIPAERILFFNVPTNDTWIRDYGVITTEGKDGSLILNDFGFNAWGGKFESNLDNAVSARMYESGLIRGIYKDYNNYILEGGSIESDGNGTIMTTSSCMLTPTRNSGISRADVEQCLKTAFGARKVLWIEKGDILGDDTDGHVDTMARFAPHNTILYCGAPWGGNDDEQAEALRGLSENLREFTDADGHPFNLLELPMPEPIYDADDGHRLPATYANFLIINGAIILPIYGQPQNDENAVMVMKVAFPDYEIVPVDCRALIRQHGSLHCATMQIPADILPL